jgi:ATP adenylyltransferase
MQAIFTPWRYAYITRNAAAGTNSASSEACFFCAAAAEPDDPERLVVHVAQYHLVMLNRHPYTNGHLMVAPLAHVAAPRDASAAAQQELWPLAVRVQEVLDRAYHPHGFNLGMNVGASAGAGVPDHFHFHVVPRWEGDTNFMSVVAEVRLIPEDLSSAWERLRRLFAGEEA